MKKCDVKLKELIEEEVLPDIEDRLDEIFEEIAKNKNSSDTLNEEIQQLHEMREEFQVILKEIENRELPKEECQELYEEIKSMIEGEDFEDDME